MAYREHWQDLAAVWYCFAAGRVGGSNQSCTSIYLKLAGLDFKGFGAVVTTFPVSQ